jgi:hypothetical protein
MQMLTIFQTLTLNFLNSAFTTTPASGVTDSSRSNLIIDFADQAIIVYAGSFAENTNNDGTVTGSRTMTITGDTFAFSGVMASGVQYIAQNVPAGLTTVVTVNVARDIATLTLTGTAVPSATDVANLSIAFQNGAFTNTTLAANVNNSSNTTGVIDFKDVALSYSTSTFSEAIANNGTISNTITITLTDDTWISASGTMTSGTHYIPANVPSGLTLDYYTQFFNGCRRSTFRHRGITHKS